MGIGTFDIGRFIRSAAGLSEVFSLIGIILYAELNVK